MYEGIAGIRPLKAGYKEILIAPKPGGPLTSAKASYDSPYGTISSAWKIEDGMFELKASIPPNTTAKMIIPANTKEDLIIDGTPLSDQTQVNLLKQGVAGYEIMVQPGSYVFESSLN
jgi:alpha-L-rhamnosidase